MNNYTNFVFHDEGSLVVLERCGHPGAPVFGPAASALRNSGAARPGADIASAVFAMMRDDTESEWSLADTIRRNDRKVLLIDIRNGTVTLHNAAEYTLGEVIFSNTITEFVEKYGTI